MLESGLWGRRAESKKHKTGKDFPRPTVVFIMSINDTLKTEIGCFHQSSRDSCYDNVPARALDKVGTFTGEVCSKGNP